jgi:hypothetical protein
MIGEAHPASSPSFLFRLGKAILQAQLLAHQSEGERTDD